MQKWRRVRSAGLQGRLVSIRDNWRTVDNSDERIPHDVDIVNSQIRLLAVLIVFHILRARTLGHVCDSVRRRPRIDDQIRCRRSIHHRPRPGDEVARRGGKRRRRRRGAACSRSSRAGEGSARWRRGTPHAGVGVVGVADGFDELLVLDGASAFEADHGLASACDRALQSKKKVVRQGCADD